MIRLFIFAYIALSISFTASAQVSDISVIRLLVGSDAVAPTTPVITGVIPQSSSQIDVAWSASSDNVYVSGYRVYRNGIFIATTTVTSFIDTGLLASTTYSYEVDAFDPSFNFSSTSLAVATTTLTPPLPPVVATSTSNTENNPSAIPTLRTINFTPTQTSIGIALSSFGGTTYTVRWGRTDAGELGQISTSIFKTEHVSSIPNLEPGTEYVVTVYLTNRFGVIREVAKERIRTLPALMSEAPFSVSGLVGEVRGADAILRWNNPDTMDTVRVVRSHLFYPMAPADGVVVYEGEGESFTDKDAFADRSPYYYSVFVFSDGRSSAPAVLRLDRVPPSNPRTETDGNSQTSPDSAIKSDTDQMTPRVPLVLSAENIFVTVANKKTVSFADLHDIAGGSQVLISIPKSAVMPHIKTIILSVTNPSDSRVVTRYLLVLNPDRTAYEAQFFISNTEGESRWGIEVFDFELAMARTVAKTVVYRTGEEASVYMGITHLGALTVIVASMFVWWFLAYRRRRREDNL
jgi:hypothetical protein